jgi:hypothetical protein
MATPNWSEDITRWGEGYVSLVSYFVSCGLVLPPIPEALRGRLLQVDSMIWATRHVTRRDLYGFDVNEIISEIASDPLDEYVAIGHVGTGINLYFLTYQMVSGPLAVLLQHGLGGVYMDPVASRIELAEDYLRARQLVDAAAGTGLGSSENGLPKLIVARWFSSSLCEPLRAHGEIPTVRSAVAAWLDAAWRENEGSADLFRRADDVLARLTA